MSAPDCYCLWPHPDEECNGLGTVECDGCGGDRCICQCGGRYPCEGCEACAWWRDPLELERDE
jgi:hypothetical protein